MKYLNDLFYSIKGLFIATNYFWLTKEKTVKKIFESLNKSIEETNGEFNQYNANKPINGPGKSFKISKLR